MRSRAGYVIGGGLVAAAVVGAILWLVTSLASVGDQVDGFARVAVPGEATVQLEARKYVVYYESSNADEFVPPFQIEIADLGTGAPLAIEPYGGSLKYSVSGRDGAAEGTVTPTRSGPYTVRTDGAPAIGANVALGKSLAWPLLRAILGTFVIGGVLLAAGVTLIIVTAIRRSRAGRAPPAG